MNYSEHNFICNVVFYLILPSYFNDMCLFNAKGLGCIALVYLDMIADIKLIFCTANIISSHKTVEILCMFDILNTILNTLSKILASRML
jgi:hypothetical protein